MDAVGQVHAVVDVESPGEGIAQFGPVKYVVLRVDVFPADVDDFDVVFVVGRGGDAVENAAAVGAGRDVSREPPIVFGGLLVDRGLGGEEKCGAEEGEGEEYLGAGFAGVHGGRFFGAMWAAVLDKRYGEARRFQSGISGIGCSAS